MTRATSVLEGNSLSETTESKRVDGRLILNADDWGRDRDTTTRILECFQRRALSSVSAMVFMEDSERASALAQEWAVDAGLHLNFTTPFSGRAIPERLVEHHRRVSTYLLRHKWSQLLYNVSISSSFEYLVAAQVEAYHSLYGVAPARIDGHHHMHLCANVLFGKLLPDGGIVRRNFSFEPGEKSRLNILYRRLTDGILRRRHQTTDYFFSLPPLQPSTRLERIFTLSHHAVVEVETHPVNRDEYLFLTTKLFDQIGDVPVAAGYTLPDSVRT